jgi:Plasmid pRiA4b ORF-3-like protein
MPKPTESPAAVLPTLLDHAGTSFYDRVREELDKQAFVGGKRVDKQQLPPLSGKAGTTVHVVKVSLYGAKPPVWRRLELPSAMTLNHIHEVLQAAFEWDDFHLHQFETVCGEFGDPGKDDSWSERDDEAAVALAQVAAKERETVVYVYDFGDDWRHDIVVEKIVPAEPGVAYPRCTGGKGAAPQEDSGGIGVFNAERAEDGVRGSRFDAGQVTESLSGLATVIAGA